MIWRMVSTLMALLVLAAAPRAQAADKVTYILDWLPSGEEPFIYVGVKDGIFAKLGLDVSIAVGRGSSDAITKMASGTAQFGSGGIGALLSAAAQNTVPVKAILSIYTKQPDAIFTVAGSPITSIKSLAGRTLATATFTSSNTIWPVIARANGLDPDSVHLIKADPTALGAMLASGKVDAMINWVTSGPEVAAVLAEAGKKLAIIPWSDSGLDGYGLSLFGELPFMQANPDITARFVRGYAQAIRVTIENCRHASEDLHAMVPIVDTDVAEAQCKTIIPLIRNEITAADGTGVFTPALMDKTWSWVARSQNYKMDALAPMSVVDTGFVPKMAAQ